MTQTHHCAQKEQPYEGKGWWAMDQREGQVEEPLKRGCEIEGWVPVLKTVARMKQAESGKGLGAEASIETLLGGVEVGVAPSASGAPESHSASKIVDRMMRGHPFLNVSCPSR